jgi:hypothetical protein
MDPQLEDVLQNEGFDVAPYDVVFSVIPILMGLFGLLFVAVVVFVVVATVRKSRLYREAGIDPLTADVERDIRLMRALENRRVDRATSPGAGAPTLEQRLDDVERLYRLGKISSTERDAARAKLIGNL